MKKNAMMFGTDVMRTSRRGGARKALGVALAAALALSLAACSGTTEQEFFPETKTDGINMYTSQYVFGYDGGTYLFDTDTGEGTFYCFDPSCTHVVDPFSDAEVTCLARILDSTSAYLTNRHLYFLESDSWDSEKLIRAEQSGTDQEVLTVFEDAQRLVCFIYQDDAAYFVFENTVSDEDGEQGEYLEQPKLRIFRVDLNTSEQTLLAEETGYSIGLLDMWAEDGILCYCLFYADQLFDYSDPDNPPTLEEQLAHCFTDIVQIDLADGMRTKLLCEQASLNMGMVGWQYFYCEADSDMDGDQSLHVLDLRTMEEQTEEAILSANMFQSCGEAVFIVGGHREGEQYMRDCYLFDPESGEILRTVSYENAYPQAVFEDGLYYDYMDETGEYLLAWISLDAFFEGRLEEHVDVGL